MGSIAYQGSASISQSDLENSFENLYLSSSTQKKSVDYVLRHISNPKILIVVDDTLTGSHVAHPGNWSQYSSSPWPFGNYDYVIRISPSTINGDYYAGFPSAVENSLERVLSHEFDHVALLVSGGQGLTLDEVEERAVDVSDRVLHEAEGEPEHARGSYANGPVDNTPVPVVILNNNAAPPIPPQTTNTPVQQAIEDAEALCAAGENQACPLILDLSHNGTIDLISLASSNAYFDRDLDGFAEASGIVAAQDGYLAFDVNSNGRIDDNGELFGTADMGGFAVLAQYDSNDDGKITAEDIIWNDLIIWQDTNENGYSEEGELYTLADHDIISLNLAATAVTQTNQGHNVTYTGTFTADSGSGATNYAMHDVWFQYDNTNTIYVGDYDLDFNALMLPVSLRGYGTIADLHIAMSMDNAGTGNLLDLVTAFEALTFAQLFDGTSGVSDDVRDIMFRWAGVDGVSPTSRGANVDARELSFLETLFDNPFLQGGHEPNPLYNASIDINNAFDIVFNHVYARLVAQSGGGELFEGDWNYDSATDSITGVTGLNLTKLGELETEATGLANTAARQTFWENVVRMVEYAVGTANLDSGDLLALQTAITDSDANLDLEDDILPTMGGDAVPYNSGNDQTVVGSSGADTLNGYAGNDFLQAGAGSDTLIGGTGSDTLKGEYDNDTYVWNDGDGDDVIMEWGGGGSDTIQFGPGITSSHLTMSRAGDYDLKIAINTGTSTGQIMINNQFNNGAIELIRFDDTSTIDLTTYNWTMNGTAGPCDLRDSAGHNQSMRQHRLNKRECLTRREAANDNGFIASATAA